MADSDSILIQGLDETNQKVESSLLVAIDEHIGSHKADHGLDFLDVKNSLLTSYLIDLVLNLRDKLTADDNDGTAASSANLHRLRVCKTALDKTRGLDKKLKYTIDKLLSKGSASYAEGSSEDPLQYRPQVEDLDDDDRNNNDEGSSSSSDDDDDQVRSIESDEEMDDLEAARQTVALAKKRKTASKKRQDDGDHDGDDDDGVYRAPRHAAVPYTHDKVDKEASRERREWKRKQASEMAQTLRAQFGDAPEQEDVHGGSALGRQREAARRMEAREAEKTRVEEDAMVRLTTTRVEKKERKRLMREEASNLGAITDLGNLVRDAGSFRGGRKGNDDSGVQDDAFSSQRHSNGKRQRQMIDRDGRIQSNKEKSVHAKNKFQEALFGGKKSGKKRRK